MANIMSREPFGSTAITPLLNEFDDLFRGFFMRPISLGAPLWGGPTPFRMDVVETDNAYRVLAEMPGVRKEDINVTIDGSDVTISAELKREHKAEDEKLLLSERTVEKYYRSFSLEHEIDEANVQARYADGVLELTLPKSARSLQKKITVQ